MIFAVPIVGKILAGFAATQASDGASTPSSGSVKDLSSSKADPAAFAKTLTMLDQAALSKDPQQHASLGAPVA